MKPRYVVVTLLLALGVGYLSHARPFVDEAKLPLLIVATVKIKPEQREAFIKAATACAEATRKEPGCVSYRLYEDPTEKGSFLYFEEWKDQAAIDEHFKAPHLATFFGTVQSMFASPPTIHRYSLADRKKL